MNTEIGVELIKIVVDVMGYLTREKTYKYGNSYEEREKALKIVDILNQSRIFKAYVTIYEKETIIDVMVREMK